MLSSADPYNTAEYMDIIVSNMRAVLTDNQSLAVDGDLAVYLHMVSHYDECKLVDIPHVHLGLDYSFVCRGSSHGHHSITRCVPSKLPVQSQGKVCNSGRGLLWHDAPIGPRFVCHIQIQQHDNGHQV